MGAVFHFCQPRLGGCLRQVTQASGIEMRNVVLSITLVLGFWQTTSWSQICPQRPAPGSTVVDPVSVRSQNGTAKLNLAVSNYPDPHSGQMFYCLAYAQGIEAPTIRVRPGETLSLNLKNEIQGLPTIPMMHPHEADHAVACDGTMTASSTNLHFHGLNVPPKCHQDEVIFTLINPGDPPFHYQMTIPANEPPGLYWYHPHPHGMTQAQIMGGASGALIVEGIEKIKPEVAGLTQRVFTFRDILNGGDQDDSTMTLNFVPVNPPHLALPVIEIGAGEKQFWRVLNAEGEGFVNLQLLYDNQPQNLHVVAVDGTPLSTDLDTTAILIPPAGRVEFVMQGPATPDVNAVMFTAPVNTGADGDPSPAHAIANISVKDQARGGTKSIGDSELQKSKRFADLANIKPTVRRKLYITEDLPNSKFFITVEGQVPKQFDPNEKPRIVTRQGAVEDWIIENRSQEIHAFHMHQIHYLLLGRDGQAVSDQVVQDTTMLEPWSGSGPYPNIIVRMDFRWPESVGTFLYHCHILDHEDGGMMAKIKVEPAN